MSKKMLVIIGSGPAALTSAIYTARNAIETVVFEGFMSGIVGGQLMTTTVIENFPGFPEGIAGPELMDNMKKQALKYGTKFISEDVKSVDLSKTLFVVKGSKTTLSAQSLIIATGAEAKKLDIPGAKEFWQKGITSCAICDGASPIFRNKEVYIVGGGDTACEEAQFLCKYAQKVFIVHRREELKASKILADKVLKNPKIEVLFNKEMVKISGKQFVEEVTLKDTQNGKEEVRKASGVFFAIGHKPNTDFLQGQLPLNKEGYIITEGKSSKTSIPGVFAAGDCQDYIYRQAITAAGSGCMAALDVEHYLQAQGHNA
jgi:thioredoxin reductase (NADPH)